MIPLLIIGAAVTAGAAIYNAYQQGKISRKEYEKRKRMLEDYQAKMDQIGPGDPPPPISLEQYKLIGSYVPEVAQYYEQQAPELITEAESIPERQMQREALSRLSNLANTGEDAISRAQQEEAAFQADAAAKSRRAQILREYEQRGLGGSGQQLLADVAGSQDADVAQRQAALRAAADAQGRRYQALGDMANLASNIRQQNTSTEKANRDIMNQFARDLASSKNSYNRYVAGVRNEAQQYNLQNAQNIANANLGLANQQNLANRAAAIDYEKQKRDWELSKADIAFNEGKGLSGLYANNARQNAQNWSNVGGAFGGEISSIGGGMAARNQMATQGQQPQVVDNGPRQPTSYDLEEDRNVGATNRRMPV